MFLLGWRVQMLLANSALQECIPPIMVLPRALPVQMGMAQQAMVQHHVARIAHLVGSGKCLATPHSFALIAVQVKFLATPRSVIFALLEALLCRDGSLAPSVLLAHSPM